jgi:hypothetical protein
MSVNTHGFNEGDLVTNQAFCEYKPFKLTSSHFRGISARNSQWFACLEYASPLDFKVYQSLIDEVSDLFSDLTDAHVSYAMGDKQLGGCKPLDLNYFKPERRPFIEEYLGNNNSVEVALKYYEFLKVK